MYGVCVRLQFPFTGLRRGNLLCENPFDSTETVHNGTKIFGFCFHTIEFYYHGAEVVLICSFN